MTPVSMQLSATFATELTDTNQIVMVKDEAEKDYFAPHSWDNRAPLWQGRYAIKQEDDSNTRTYFKDSEIPNQYRVQLKREIRYYKSLRDDDRKKFLDGLMTARKCENSDIPALIGQMEVIAARDISPWSLLGHYAAQPMMDKEYQSGAKVTGAASSRIDTYAFALPEKQFLSGYCRSNILSLINANTTYENDTPEREANVGFLRHQDKGRWLILIISRDQICKGNTLWIDYGEAYWKDMQRVIDITTEDETDSYTTDQQITSSAEPDALSTAAMPHSSTGNESNRDVQLQSTGTDSPVTEESGHSDGISPPFTCKHCNKTLSSRRTLRDHIFIHTGKKPYSCKECNIAFTRQSSVKTHMLLHIKKPKKCKQCNETLYTLDSIRKHKRLHTANKLHRCKRCKKTFNKRKTLKRHMLVHTGEKPHQCSTCKKKFSHKHSLIRHIESHNTQKSYQCEECDKAFKGKHDLDQHRKIHNHKFQCSICNKSFPFKRCLDPHMLSHTDKKPHKCETCGQGFNKKYHLVRHMKSHTRKFKCKICSQGFTLKSILVKHMLLHSDDRKHQCTKCGNRFPGRYFLKRHMRMHTNKKPYKCPECAKGFTNPYGLKKHKCPKNNQATS